MDNSDSTTTQWIPHHGPAIGCVHLAEVLSQQFRCVACPTGGNNRLVPVGSTQIPGPSVALSGLQYIERQRAHEPEVNERGRSRHRSDEAANVLQDYEYRTEVIIESVNGSLAPGVQGTFEEEARKAAVNLLPYAQWSVDPDDVSSASAQVCKIYFGDYESGTCPLVSISVKSARTVRDLSDRLRDWSLT